ncbi:MAG TPA: Holliday junction branch migration protein RuvA [Nitrospiraceae bacterium]|nr:Holliday junction branch migration protein RuvA [Nitrospiraceae bacterium]
MIAALTGRLAAKAPSHITLEVQGVGYEVFIPLSTFYSLPDLNESASLKIYTHLRDDAIQLFGFLTAPEKDVFILLTGISGIGPKLALSVLSALSVPDLIAAVQASDVDKLATVPGIGKKSAGRIALELKDKVARLHPAAVQTSDVISGPTDQLQEDALSALVNLGYRATEAKEVLKRIDYARPKPITLRDLIREALKDLARG